MKEENKKNSKTKASHYDYLESVKKHYGVQYMGEVDIASLLNYRKA